MRPWLKIKQGAKFTDVHLCVPVAPGQLQTFTTRVDNAMVRSALERAGVEVGFSLGGLWKGVKKVAKVTGISTVLHAASKALDNPLVKAVLPVAAIGGPALKVASGLLGAKLAAERGDPRAKRLLLKAAAMAKQPHAPAAVRDGHELAERIYTLRITPA